MERLTEKQCNGNVGYKVKGSDGRCTKYCMKDCNACSVKQCIDKLGDYEDLEEEMGAEKPIPKIRKGCSILFNLILALYTLYGAAHMHGALPGMAIIMILLISIIILGD